MVTKTYLPSNLCDSSDIIDISDSSDTSDSSDSTYQKTFSYQLSFSHTKKNFLFHNFFFTFFFIKKILSNKSETKIMMKLKTSNCDGTQTLKL